MSLIGQSLAGKNIIINWFTLFGYNSWHESQTFDPRSRLFVFQTADSVNFVLIY